MNKKLLLFALTAVVVTGMVACKGKNKEGDNTNTEQTSNNNDTKPAEESKPSGPINEPKTFILSFTPDSLYLGKDKEAYVKITSGEAVELQDPDGKAQGMSVKIDMRCTNKSTLDKQKYFNVSPGDARMELDNGTNITYRNGDSLNPDAEASEESTWEFDVPAGAKPTKLNLFMDGTRVSLAISLADKK